MEFNFSMHFASSLPHIYLPRRHPTQQMLHKIIPILLRKIIIVDTLVSMALTRQYQHIKFFIGLDQGFSHFERGGGIDVFIDAPMGDKELAFQGFNGIQKRFGQSNLIKPGLDFIFFP